jgi:hypothetical protein
VRRRKRNKANAVSPGGQQTNRVPPALVAPLRLPPLPPGISALRGDERQGGKVR